MIPILQSQKQRLGVWTGQVPATAPTASCVPQGPGWPGEETGEFQDWPLLAAKWADKFLPIGTPRGPEAGTAPKSRVALGTLLPSALL